MLGRGSTRFSILVIVMVIAFETRACLHITGAICLNTGRSQNTTWRRQLQRLCVDA